MRFIKIDFQLFLQRNIMEAGPKLIVSEGNELESLA